MWKLQKHEAADICSNIQSCANVLVWTLWVHKKAVKWYEGVVVWGHEGRNADGKRLLGEGGDGASAGDAADQPHRWQRGGGGGEAAQAQRC